MIPLDSYPAESWRPNQRDGAELICAAAASGQEIRIGIDAPCGSGKSLMALRAALSPHCPPCNILSTTRAHLRQYEQTLQEHYPELEGKAGGWAILRGRSFYACCGSAAAKAKGRGAASAQFAADADPSEEWIGSRKCPRGEGCLYRQAIIKAGAAKLVLQCTIGFLYRRRFWGEIELNENASEEIQLLHESRLAITQRDLIILDEAHEYLRVRREFELERLSFWPEMCSPEFGALCAKERTKSGGYKASYVVLEPGSRLREALERELLILLTPAKLEAARPHRKLSDQEWGELKVKWQEKLKARLALVQQVERPAGAALNHHALQPVLSLQFNEFAGKFGNSCELVSEPLFAYVKEKLARCEVFMSATLKEVAPLLKIPGDCVRKYPEIFDWERAVTINPLEDPNADSRKNVPLGSEQLEALYNVPGRPLTLVLYMAKAHANAAVKGWGMKAKSLLIQSDQSELSDLIEKARLLSSHSSIEDQDAPLDAIAPMLVCYGGWVGTDLPGEKWLVIGSAPKSPISPHHEARQLRGRGSAWNDAEKISLDRTQLAQGLGRMLRSNTDTGTLIWIDSQAFRDLGLCATTGRVSD